LAKTPPNLWDDGVSAGCTARPVLLCAGAVSGFSTTRRDIISSCANPTLYSASGHKCGKCNAIGPITSRLLDSNFTFTKL